MVRSAENNLNFLFSWITNLLLPNTLSKLSQFVKYWRAKPQVHPAILLWFALCFVFQIHVSFQLLCLYLPLKILFYIELIIVVVSFFSLVRKHLFFLILPLIILGIRLPFLLKSDGLIFTSDNALEALQSLQIQDTHQAPFFLLNAINHNGTFAHTLIAFIWDVFGSSYLSFVLVQLSIFIAFHFVLYFLLKRFFSEKTLRLLLLLNFIFIPILFDYSLYLRAGPYFQVLFFLVLGLSLFDPFSLSPLRLFLSLYFIFFSLYLNPVGVFFAFCFLLVVIYFLATQKLLRKNGLAIGTAIIFGGYPWLLAWKKNMISQMDYGGWFQIKILSLKEIFSLEFLALIREAIRDSCRVFLHIFSFEFNYLRQFFAGRTSLEDVFSLLNNVLIVISAGVFIYVLIQVGGRLGKDFSQRKIRASNCFFYFFFLLVIAEIGEIFFLQPSHMLEPRHHLDLAFLLIVSFVVFISNILQIRKIWSLKSLIVIALLVILSFPHLYYYYLQTDFKQHSYQTIIKCLAEHKIKYLTTDFIIAYPLYFLAKRKIQVSNSLGPLTVRFFFPKMDRLVDNIPLDAKAYLFFSNNYWRERWHINLTAKKRKETINSLRSARIPYKIINLNKYWLIVPKKHLP